MKIPKCQECGACCSFEKLWVEVTEKDAKRLGRPGLLVPGDIRKYAMATDSMQSNRCIALGGELGKFTYCAVYEKRPSICRKVKRGSPICLYMLGFHKLGRPW